MDLSRRDACLALAAVLTARGAGAGELPPLPLRIGWGDYPPFQVAGAKGPQGLDVELLALLAQGAGERLLWLQRPWARQLADLASGEQDLVSSATYAPERLAFAEYTSAYRTERVALLALANGAPPVARLAELKGRAVRVGMIRGTVFPAAVRHELDDPELQRLLVPLYANDLSLQSLRARRVDYVIDDPVTLLSRVQRDAGEPVTVVLELAVSPVHLLVSKHALSLRPDLVQRLNHGLQRARLQPEWAQVLARYPGA